jgi:ribosomal protein S18 acetylase RimI-like enzyme
MAACWAGRCFAPPLLTLVAEERGSLTGFVCAFTDRDPPFVDNLHVAPDRTGRGTGGALLRALAARLRARDVEEAQLTVLAGNARARAFYRRMGGQEGAGRPHRFLGCATHVHPVRLDLCAPAFRSP